MARFKICQFCGGNAIMLEMKEDGNVLSVIACPDCGRVIKKRWRKRGG